MQDLRGGRGVQGVQGCLEGGQHGGSRGGGGNQGKKRQNTKKTEKARMRVQRVQGCLGGSRGFQAGCRGGPEVWANTNQKNAPCAAGQMAEGAPFRCLPWTPPISRCWRGKRGRLNLPSVQHANQGWRISIYTYVYICITYIYTNLYTYICIPGLGQSAKAQTAITLPTSFRLLCSWPARQIIDSKSEPLIWAVLGFFKGGVLRSFNLKAVIRISFLSRFGVGIWVKVWAPNLGPYQLPPDLGGLEVWAPVWCMVYNGYIRIPC